MTLYLKPTNTHLHCSVQKWRLHPSLNQETWLEAEEELFSKIQPECEFGSKNTCSCGEEGNVHPDYHMLLERPPTWETEFIGHENHTSPSAGRNHQQVLSFSPWANTNTYKVVESPCTTTQITLQAMHSEAARVTAWAGMRSARLGHLLTAVH